MKQPHPYSLGSRENVVHAFAIAGVLLALAFGVLVEHVYAPPWWLDTPAVLGFYSLLYLLLDRVAWRWGWVKRLLSLPNIDGRWRGILRTSHDSIEKDHAAVLIVRQTWSKVLICLEGDMSRSASTAAHVFDGSEAGTFEIVYSYENVPRADAGDTLQAHYGTAHLVFSMADGTELLDGDYYTGRGRHTHGRLILRREKPQTDRAI